MSLYSKELELLCFVEKLKALSPELKCRFTCRCRCEASFPFANPYPLWRVHHFGTVEETRSWIGEHKGHEAYVDVEFEGIRPAHRSGGDSRRRRDGVAAGVDSRAATDKRGRLTEKLRALARNTPYAQEAEAALRKIAELSTMCTEGAAGGVAMSTEPSTSGPPRRKRPPPLPDLGAPDPPA